MKKLGIHAFLHCRLVKKLLLTMKLTFLIFLFGLMQVSATVYSQSTKFSLRSENKKVIDILREIEENSNFRFFYQNEQVNVQRSISLRTNNATVEQILDKIFADEGISYKIMDNNLILLSPDKNIGELESGSSQQKSITGRVIDENGQSLPMVTVLVKGTTNGTVTDLDGNYSISNIQENTTLVFSFIGMITQEISVGKQTKIDITMAADAIGIEEVVAIGYGTQKKVNMTGSVSSVKFDELANSRPITNVSSALSGLSSGVYVKQSVGKPGSDGATIRIRGVGTLNNSNPLVIIDGMEGTLDDVNPQDIETVSILKDAASSSIYGSRAANGVILVTTKKGDGKKLSVTYNGIFSVAQPTNLLNFVSDYPTYMGLMNESARNIGTAEVFSSNTISAWDEANKNPDALNEIGIPNYVSFPNTDWNKKVYKNNLVQDHTVSVTGATQSARFLLSAGYLDNPGLVDYTGMNRFTFRSNVEIDVQKWLTVGTRTYGSMTDTELGNYANVLTYIVASTPGTYGIYNGKYAFPEATEETSSATNVLAAMYPVNGDDKETRINTTLYSKVTFIKGLTWDLNFNYFKLFSEYNSHTNPTAVERYKLSTGVQMIAPTVPSKMGTTYNNSSNYYYTLENLLRYNTILANKHDISTLLGYNETYHYNSSIDASKQGLVDENAYVFDAATLMNSIGGSASDWSLRSYFGRLNYAFDQRFLFEANLRYDGSSRFSEESRYGLFPSFSAGWRISQEGFMKDSRIFQNLKLRASWGELGNNASGNYDYQAAYGAVDYSFGGNQVTGLRSGKISNALLRWESTSMANIGFDASILKGKLSAEMDVYNKVTDGILTTPPIYLTLGTVGAPTRNTAEVTNKGLELTLIWKDKIGQVGYSISGNLGYNKNEVTGYKGKLVQEWQTDEAGNPVYYSNLGDVSSGGQTRILEGHVIKEQYLMDVYQGDGKYFNADQTVNISGGPKDGMIRTPDDVNWLNAMIAAGYQFMPNLTNAKNKIWYGDYIYSDINKDGIYGNSYDNHFTGSSNMPKFTFGSQMSFNWKNFDLNLIWSGQAGIKIHWLEYGYNKSNTRIGQAIGEMTANDHYYYNDADPSDPTNNITATYPRLKLNDKDTQNSQASTRWLYDGSYLRLRNLTLGYTLPNNIATKIFTKQVRLYFSAENLLTITSFPGLDPEMGGNTNYPLFRQIAFGTNITF